MLPFVEGTVREHVKLAAMDSKWQQRKNEITKTVKEKYGNSEKARGVLQILHYQEDLERIRENSRQSEIYEKIQSGGSLTPEEIEYLKQKDPKAYQAYREAKIEEKAYEEQLKKCDTKEDVEKLENVKMGEFLSQVKEVADDPVIPKGEKLAQIEKIYAKAKRVQKVHDRFVKSLAFASLPTEEGTDGRKSREKILDDHDGIVIKKMKQDDTNIIYMDEDEDRAEGEETGQARWKAAPEQHTYYDVAVAIKEYAADHRETGDFLSILSDIERDMEKNGVAIVL